MGLSPNQRDHLKSDLFALVLVSVNRGVVQTEEDVATGVANPRGETSGAVSGDTAAVFRSTRQSNKPDGERSGAPALGATGGKQAFR